MKKKHLKVLLITIVSFLILTVRYYICSYEYDNKVVHYYDSIIDTEFDGEVVKLSKGKKYDTLYIKERYTDDRIYFNNSDWIAKNVTVGDKVYKNSADSFFVFSNSKTKKALTYKFNEQELSSFWQIFFYVEY